MRRNRYSQHKPASGLGFRHDHLDHAKGQDYWRLVAYLPDAPSQVAGYPGQVVGYLDYSEFQGKVYVDMVLVHKDMRRRGIGTALMHELERKAAGEGSEVVHGMQTDEGAALVRSLHPKTAQLAREHPEYPMAGPIVSGLAVSGRPSNQGSIAATMDDYEILPGIREVQFSQFTQMGDLSYYSTSEKSRTMALAERIRDSGQIEPLIVVVDDRGPYVLEGGHRFNALRELGVKSLPAMVVLEITQTTSAAWVVGNCKFARQPKRQ